MRVKEFRTFGTSLLTLLGALNVAQGLLVAYAGDSVGFDRNDVAFTSAGTWAVATATLGALLVAAGLALRAGRPSAKTVAVAVVALHAISQLAMLRAYPAWSLLMVTLDVIILFILTVPRGSVAAPEDVAAPKPARPAPTAKLTLRRNSRSDAYHGRHKAGGRPHVRHSVSRDDIITIDLLPPAVVGASLEDTVVVTASVGAPVIAPPVEETVEAELVGDSPTVWVRAVGQAAVTADVHVLADVHVPVQRSSLESLDPLIDPLPMVLAEEAALAARTVDEEAEELAAIGARPYVHANR
ncbi:hypothetical protein Dvina_04460 [Dactylosporangium vinaceum]|uniref:DUF7144 domain-containing protein n=1 Tax=Dactylosporangium vinaceum TaxID=53362 RepID=A0ABV5MHW9_9ACTN|nr:hypothetical protein [Dactylosporangium vinaceum]UAB97436.1 hypothetical protein Dvina_04460 [Dactylosporangium vinaceum]